MKNNKLTNILLTLSFIVLIFGSGYKIGEYKSRFTSLQPAIYNQRNINFDLFWETWNKLQESYVDQKKVDPKKMYLGAIKGMVASIEDPYTFFLTPEENKQTKDDLGGKFEGIGAQLGLKNNRIIIIAPLKKSPAEVSGVKPGDFINKVDGVTTSNWTLTQAVSKIRGPKNTKVKLTLERNNKEIEVTIVRQQIIIASVEVSYEKNIAILKINQFGDNTNDEWNKAVEEINRKWSNNKQVAGLVLDLRDNPGGYLDSSVYLASEFLPLGKLIVKQEATLYGNKEYRVSRIGVLKEIPLVILINKGSASASEILAGALRDHSRAQLVGEKSFGKGSVQEALDLREGAGLHVTVAKWVLPNGDWINGKGIEPKIKVINEIKEGNTITKEVDKQLEKAIELLTK
ncbi:S41 family peptidase [Candidatus Roizmanbacteria bacterium CG_4_9_14_3_um_filter_33_18]|uniref:S41 family peptidase n=3 Tax=Candidatus Roizmaniibacteriota TaxID=1752723 RepID=A0A2M7U8V5_9BACT|nr:MAG: peptidase S41 [Candidatus Roizmanbacteria bacterium CG22_combo_CG10-13_8_21_14_all_34_12]PIZ67670.1 MAG: S41 family peptidase [Candidatus Roizmanbacteria bacterium CG_4_10_14_0_2_um_filter_33_96]PJA56072.1 MAG: S41 family peptidase [Candidatus Roizmanbacteria bacterium CG_4_9_14_3_um_filter_33_18]